jgi:hypothetical protein
VSPQGGQPEAAPKPVDEQRAINLDKARAAKQEKRVEELSDSIDPRDNAAKIKALVEDRIESITLYRQSEAGPSGQRRNNPVARIRHTPDNASGEFRVGDPRNGDLVGWIDRVPFDGQMMWAVRREDGDGAIHFEGYAETMALGADVLTFGLHGATGRHDSRRISPGRFVTPDEALKVREREARNARARLAAVAAERMRGAVDTRTVEDLPNYTIDRLLDSQSVDPEVASMRLRAMAERVRRDSGTPFREGQRVMHATRGEVTYSFPDEAKRDGTFSWVEFDDGNGGIVMTESLSALSTEVPAAPNSRANLVGKNVTGAELRVGDVIEGLRGNPRTVDSVTDGRAHLEGGGYTIAGSKYRVISVADEPTAPHAEPLDTSRAKRDDGGMTTTAPSKPPSKLAYTRDTSLRYAYHQERLIGPPPGRNYDDPGMREWNDKRNQVMRGTEIRDALGDQAARDARQAGSVQQWLGENGYIEPNHMIAWNALTEKGRKLVESTSPTIKPEKREASKPELPSDDRVRAVMSAVNTADQARALGFEWTDTPLNVGDEVMVDTFGKLRGGIVTRVGSKNVAVAYMTPSGGYTQTATRENKAIMRRVREADPRAFRGQALQPKPVPVLKPTEAERAAAKRAQAETFKAEQAKRNEEWTNLKVATIREALAEDNENRARTEVTTTNEQGLRAIARAFGIKSTPRGMGDRQKTEWLRNEILDRARKPRVVSGDDHVLRIESSGGPGIRSGKATPAVVTCATCGARATGKTVAGAKRALVHHEPRDAGKA